MCPLEDGMRYSKYIPKPEYNGSHTPSKPNIHSEGEGVTFTSKTSLISIEIAPSITPIIEYISVPNKAITNVNRLIVTIVGSDGSNLGTLKSELNSTIVSGFPITPLPENTTLLITFNTKDGTFPRNVTISVLACYHPSVSPTATSSNAKSIASSESDE
jgi:hypothetical protein